MDKERSRLLKQLEKLARCRVNDAVKLAFLGEREIEEIDQLAIAPLPGFKRSDKGGVEVQLVDRAAILKMLVELSGGGEDQQVAEFFQAWEKRAEGQEEA